MRLLLLFYGPERHNTPYKKFSEDMPTSEISDRTSVEVIITF